MTKPIPLYRLGILWLIVSSSMPWPAAGQSHSAAWLREQYFFQQHLAQDLVLDIVQDEQGFMWFATNNGLIRYDGSTLKTYRNIPGDTTSLGLDYTTSLALEKDHTLWIGTAGKGLNRFHLKTGKFTRFQKTTGCTNCLSHNRIGSIYAKAQHVWVGTVGRGLNRYDLAGKKFHRWDTHTSNPAAAVINDLVWDASGHLWLGTDAGLARFDTSRKELVIMNTPLIAVGQPAKVTALAVDKSGTLWCGTITSGLFRYHMAKDEFLPVPLADMGLPESSWQHIWDILPGEHHKLWLATEAGLALLDFSGNNRIAARFDENLKGRASSIYKSKDGVIWVGTGNGVKSLVPREKQFHTDTLPPPIKGVYLHSPSNTGDIWIGTYRGLYQYDRRQHHFHRDFLKEHPNLERFSQGFISGLLLDSRDRLWIAEITNFDGGSGFFRYDLNTRVLTDFSEQFRTSRWYFTRQITEDRLGNIWIANDNEFGLLGYDNRSATFNTHPIAPPDAMIKGARALHADQDGFLWIGWLEAGVSRYDPQSKEIVHFTNDPEKPDQLVHNSIWWMEDCGDDQLCIGTEGGLSILNKKTGKCRNYTIRDGLLDAKVDNILPDRHNKLWLTTRHGLYQLDPQTGMLRNYDSRDGMDFGLFVGQSALRDSAGNLYFGGHNGLIRFHPNHIYASEFPPPVQITQFRLFNKEVQPGSPDGILEKEINHTDHLELRHDQYVITFDYSALSYINAGKHQYAYRLENFDPDWQYVKNQKSVTYTNLDPGEYVLHLKAANADSIWSAHERRLRLTIMPPWYWAWWSKTLYLLAIAATLYTIYRFQLSRRLQQAEARRLQELDAFKTRLYTNITHEFRTPLTVISGMTDQVLNDPENWFREGLTMIKRNSRQLLRLVNQMLELSKLEAGTLPIHLVQGDLVSYLKYLTESFHSYAGTKNIRLHLLPEIEELQMDYDPEKIQTIYSNLVGNAIKFTPEGGDVYVKIQQQQQEQNTCCQIRISDTGPGIPEEQLPHIFDRFYQGNDSATQTEDGSGIGLALTRELVKLLGGSIEVKSRLEKGTEFTIWLPVKREATDLADSFDPKPGLSLPVDKPQPENNEQPATKNLPLALLIEDNKDVLRYLTSCLNGQYRLTTASNGEEGITRAIETIPDIIISDVTMPGKDGFEVVETLKTDERTSHIPIILLTAKADAASRIQGLEYGADAYLAKPFDKKELEVRLRKLIELRRQLQERYQMVTRQAPTASEAVDREDKFLQKVRRLVEANLGDEDFGIPQLCTKLAISRIQLHRKLKALTDQSTSHFIRSIRLQKAKTLLTETELTVAEIAYQTGFRSSNYFSQVFTSEFGKPPTAFRRENG